MKIPELPEISLSGTALGFSPTRLFTTILAVVLFLASLVAVMIFGYGLAESVVTVSGLLVPVSEYDVLALEEGEIAEVRVATGLTVATGDTLLLLRSEQLNEQLRQASFTIEEQQAALRQAVVDTGLDRARLAAREATAGMRLQVAAASLRNRMADFQIPNSVDSLVAVHRSGKHTALDQAVAEYRMAEIEFRSAQFDLANTTGQRSEITRIEHALRRAIDSERSLRARMNRLSLVSPVNGLVTTEALDRLYQNHVLPGQRLISIADISSWTVEAIVPETDIDKIDPGNPAILAIPALSDSDLPDLTGVVLSVAPSSTGIPASRTAPAYLVRISLDSAWANDSVLHRLRPGFTVQVQIVTDKTSLARRIMRRLDKRNFSAR